MMEPEESSVAAAATASPTQQEQQQQQHAVCKFHKGDRVFAKDVTSGLLYEAVIRRIMFGLTRQRQLHAMHSTMSSTEVEEYFQQEPEEKYHMFVHYLGWNVRHDRWVGEDCLYEHNEQNKKLAQQLQQVVKEVKQKHRKTSKATKGVKIWMDLEQRMKKLEQERRAEEKREELAKQGITMMEQDEKEEDEEEDSKPAARRKKQWTQAAIDKELSLREQSLQGRRQQALAEKLVLPFSLKKIMVDEWEIITQCNMLPNLPASVTVHDALNKYLQYKLELMLPANESPEEEEEKCDADEKRAAVDETVTTTKAAAESTQEEAQDNDNLAKKQQEWKDMVEGIEMLFDQTAPHYLLYRQELPQLQQDETLAERRPSEFLGCEHLLRFFVHLPALLAGQLSDVESRPIYSKLGDLVRFLQKHQSSLFAQSYHPVKEEQESSKAKKRRGGVGGKKRKSASTGGNATAAKQSKKTEEEESATAAADPEEETTTTKMVELPPGAKTEPL